MFFFLIALDFGASCLRAYTLATLWGWFIIPLGAMPISMPAFFGMLAVKSVFFTTIKRDHFDEWTTEQKITKHIVWLLACPTILAEAWLALKVMS